jgi:uncharacterized protein (TIGR02246 family)
MLGAGGALLLSGSAFATSQAPEATTPPPSSGQMQHQGEPVPNQAKDKDIADLKKQATAFTEAWNAKDSKTLSNLFTQDAALLIPSGESAVGRQEIEQTFTKELQAEENKDAQMSVQVESVRQLKPDLLLSDAIYTVTGPNVQNGKPMEVHAVVIAQKQGNQWLFREARAIAEQPMQQMGVGGSGEQPGQENLGQEPAPPPGDTGGSGMEQQPVEQQPVEQQPTPDTGGSGLETGDQGTQPSTGGSGTEQQNTGGGELEQQPKTNEPTY